jgi:hypothetical protein
VANDACLQTVPRTINTGLGALFILVALYVLGGETLTDFALALLVGILVGTWSSVFTATPLAVLFNRGTPTPKTPPPVPEKRVLVPAAAGVDHSRPRITAGPRTHPPRPRKRRRGGR